MKKQLIFTTFLICILALTSFTALMPLQVNGESVEIKILSYNWYIAETTNAASQEGDIVIVGELQNVGTSILHPVFVVGIAYIGDVEAACISEQALTNNLRPGQKAPFYIDFLPQSLFDEIIVDNLGWEDITNVVVEVGYFEITSQNVYQDLTVSSEGYFPDADLFVPYTVLGTIKNEGAGTVGGVRVITTFYDDTGTVVSLNYTTILSDAFAPGASKNFVATPVDLYSKTDNITKYESVAYYTILRAANTSPPATKTPSPTGVSPTATPPGLGITTTTIIIVAILAAIAAIVSILLYRKKYA